MTTATTADFKLVKLSDIKPDPNQPRKIYDETAMQELAESVKSKGVLQPILVRPIGTSASYTSKDPAAPMNIEIRRGAGYTGPEFLLVCGERRYRASNEAGLLEIPAVIRELSDEEALELQIVENLQRKDVHPMEEAVAFKSLLENKTRPLTVEEVAAKVGKSVYFIKQRLKLNALSEDWQKAFYLNKLETAEALSIGQLSAELQAELFKDKTAYNKGWEKSKDFEFSISSWDIERRQMKLNSAPFDKKDETLNPKMGACTTCPFNSAVACLFPEDAKDPRCNKKDCFDLKCAVSFERKLKEVMDDPAAVLVDNEHYRYNEQDATVKKLEKAGQKVYSYPRHEYNRVSTHNKEYKKDLETGKVLKAFVVAGPDKGTHIYISLSKKGSGSSKATANKLKNGKVSTADIDDEIIRIEEREKRAVELDTEKIHARLVEAFRGIPAVTDIKTPMGIVEKTAMIYLMYDAGDYTFQSELKKIGLSKSHGQNAEKLWAKLCALGEGAVGYIFRNVMLNKYGRSLASFTSGGIMHTMMKSFPDIPYEAFKTEQEEAAAKRKVRVEKRIADLQAKKKELQAAAKTSSKKVKS